MLLRNQAAASVNEDGFSEPLLPSAAGDAEEANPGLIRRSLHTMALWFRFKKPPRMTTRERLTLSPIKKWSKFGRFPIKLVLHFAITVLAVIQINLLSSQFTPYSRAANRVFSRVFVPREPLISIDETVGWLNSTVEHYYRFPERSVNRWIPAEPDVRLTVRRYVRNPYDPARRSFNFSAIPQTVEQYLLNRTALPPFDALAKRPPTELREYVYSLVSLKTDLAYVNVQAGALGAVPVLWNITLRADFSSDGGEVGIRMGARPSVVAPHSTKELDPYSSLQPTLWISGVLAALASISFLLSIKELLMGWRLYLRTRLEFPRGVKLYEEPPPPSPSAAPLPTASPDASTTSSSPSVAATATSSAAVGSHPPLSPVPSPLSSASSVLGVGHHARRLAAVQHASAVHYTEWDQVPLDIKLQFFSSWAASTVVGSLAVIMSTVYNFAGIGGLALSEEHHLWLGLGTALYCLSFLRYAEFSDRMYTLSLTVKMAAARVTRMLCSVMPAFLAFMLFGTVVFSRYSDRFATMDETAVTLFSLLNGDDIHASFNDLFDNYPYPVISRVYLYFFVAFFITTVLNIFIFVIEDAFVSAKEYVWGDSSVEKQRRPFDVRQLFDVIEERKRQAEARANARDRA